MTRRRNLPLLLFAAFTLFLGSCAPLTPAPSANPTSPSPSLWVTVSPKQVARNEAILAIAKPLIEKANRTYLIPGWIHFEIRTEHAAPLPEGSSVPEGWRDETWALLDENGEAFQSITFHDTGNVKTSYITVFQDGAWWGLTDGSVSDFQGSTYPVALDINFLEGAEYYINAVELGYDEMDTMDNERMAVFTMPNANPVDINSGQAGQLTRASLTKFYFSITSGLLMKTEEYTTSPTGPIQTFQRITTLVENVEQPPAEVLKYLTYAPMTPAVSAYPSPPSPMTVQAHPTGTAYPTAWPTRTAFPTAWQEYPTPNLPPSAWPEYSSEYKYSNRYTLETGFLKYSFRYPPGWYLYPGSNTTETYFQNFERIGTDMEAEPQFVGSVKVTLFALPCKHSMDSCPTGLPELVPGLPGHQEVNVISDWTVWMTSLYSRGFVIYLSAYMIGTPEQNANLIKILNEILSTFVVYDGGLFPPAKTPTPGPTYPPGPPTMNP